MKIICTDAGNTLVKIAVVDDGKTLTVMSFPLENTEQIAQYAATLPVVDAGIMSSVSTVEPELIKILSERVTFFF